jgi:RimJ/RimL family protein N-acetyltransferase
MGWIEPGLVLTGANVQLVPLQREHFPGLIEVGKQQRIWEFTTINGADEAQLSKLLSSSMLMRATGERYPFTVIDRKQNKIIGGTMFHNIFPEHKKLEIGWTWYDPAYWRTGYNKECKLLLLTYCFETLKTIRVQFQVDEVNQRSRNAVLGIGATFEGLLRKERLRANGSIRTTAMYSIIDDEWPSVKQLLQERLKTLTA